MLRKFWRLRTLLRQLRIHWRVMRDPRTPPLARWMLVAAFVYLLMPFDLFSDLIPLLGLVDDIILVPALFVMGMKLVPPEVKRDSGSAARDADEPIDVKAHSRPRHA